jgi:hypothetical protein
VPSADYIVFDRGQLAYLNLLERFNCFYCSDANGLIALRSGDCGTNGTTLVPNKT